MANGYRAGGNTKFFGKDKEAVQQALMNRLNMDDTSGDMVMPSMLAFPMAASQYEEGTMDIAMSVTTRFLPYEVASSSHSSFPGGEAMFKIYNELFGLRAVHFGEDLRASENMEYMSQGSTNNSLCFMGPHRRYDGLSKSYTQLVPGMGHWGPDARPGVRCTTFELVLVPRMRACKAHKLVCCVFCNDRTHAGVAESRVCASFSQTSHPTHLPSFRTYRLFFCASVNMISARESMMTYEQLSYIPKPKV